MDTNDETDIYSKFYTNNGELLENLCEKNIELLFVYIEDYKIFKTPQKINLNAKYNIEYDEDKNQITISKNKDFVEFPELENINLKILCGENGTGKSTLIDLLKGIWEKYNPKFFVLMKDKNGNYYANKEGLIVNGKKLSKTNLEHDSNTQIQLKNLFTENDLTTISNGYINYKTDIDNLFKDERNDCEIFTHYNIIYKDFYEKIEIIVNVLKKIITEYKNLNIDKNISNDIDLYENKIVDYCYENPVNYMILYELNNNVLDKFVSNLPYRMNSKKIKIDLTSFNKQSITEFLDFIIAEFGVNKNKLKKANDELIRNYLHIEGIDKQKQKDFQIEEKQIFSKDFIDLTKCIDEIIKSSKQLKNMSSSFNSLNLFDISIFNKRTDLSFEDLSTGEQERIGIAVNLVSKMSQSDNNSIIFEDESCAFAHPEWCRRFLKDYLDILKKLKEQLNQKDKMINVIIATHSPFILSDVQRSDAILLQRDKDDNITSRMPYIETFGANIHDLLKEGFFLKSTMGEFAKEQIETIIEDIETIDSHEKFKEREKRIDIIGEPIIKNSLLKKLFLEKGEYQFEDFKKIPEKIKEFITKLKSENIKKDVQIDVLKRKLSQIEPVGKSSTKKTCKVRKTKKENENEKLKSKNMQEAALRDEEGRAFSQLKQARKNPTKKATNYPNNGQLKNNNPKNTN